MITVGHLAPMGCWDSTMLFQLLDNKLYPTRQLFKHVDGFPHPDTNGCVLIIPGRYWFEQYDQITEALAPFRWVLAIRTGDEENMFNPARVEHPNIKWWVQTPETDVDYGDDRLIGVGWTPAFNSIDFDGSRPLDVFLSGQDTHYRRNQCFDTLSTVRCTKIVERTEGFTQGMEPDQYVHNMAHAKVAPAPSGAYSPDSFRLFEALQAHTVPIADDVSPNPKYDARGYWNKLFPDAPFPTLERYGQLPGYIADQLALWPANANRITIWWMRYKRDLTTWLLDDLKNLGAL